MHVWGVELAYSLPLLQVCIGIYIFPESMASDHLYIMSTLLFTWYGMAPCHGPCMSFCPLIVHAPLASLMPKSSWGPRLPNPICSLRAPSPSHHAILPCPFYPLHTILPLPPIHSPSYHFTPHFTPPPDPSCYSHTTGDGSLHHSPWEQAHCGLP